MGVSIALNGKAAPTVVKLSTAHSEQTLIDMRKEGNNPKMKMPKACEARMVITVSAMIIHWLLALVKWSTWKT